MRCYHWVLDPADEVVLGFPDEVLPLGSSVP